MSYLRTVLVMLLGLCLGAGCRRQTAKNSADDKAAKREPATGTSTAQDIIETMTGRTAVKSGLKARDIIKKTSAEKNADLDDVYGMGADK